MALTTQQEKFAQAYVSGMTKAAAYRHAYPAAGKWKPNTVHKEAWALAAHPKVSPRIRELRAELASANLMDKTEYMGLLAEAVRTPISDIHEDHPLCQAAVDTAYGRNIRSVSKLEAGKQLAALSGWTEEEDKKPIIKVIIGGNAEPEPGD